MLTIQKEMKFHDAEPPPSAKQLQDLLFLCYARVAYFNANWNENSGKEMMVHEHPLTFDRPDVCGNEFLKFFFFFLFFFFFKRNFVRN